MKIPRRKNWWQRALEKNVARAADNTGLKAGAATLAGATVLTAASAVVSKLRREGES